MKKLNKKGFTLTELIVVIVIIGILAAVLVPSITQYVDKARLANDKSDVRNMNMILSTMAYEENFNYLLSNEVCEILENEGYSLDARAKNYYYFYDVNNNKIVLKQLQNGEFIEEGASTTGYIKLATSSLKINMPSERARELKKDTGLLFIDQSNSVVANAVNTIANLMELAQNKVYEDLAILDGEDYNVPSKMKEYLKELFDGVFNQLDDELTFKGFLEEFSLDNTIYADSAGYYTNYASGELKNLIIAAGTTSLIASGFNDISSISNPVYIPGSVREIMGNSVFNNLPAETEIIIPASSNAKEELLNNFPEKFTNVTNAVPNSYQKYNEILNIEITYVVDVMEVERSVASSGNTSFNVPTGNTVEYTFYGDSESYIGIPEKGYAIGENEPQKGSFKVNFSDGNGNSIIIEGASVEIRHTTQNDDFYTYEVRLYDKDGTLYALGKFKYYYTNNTIMMQSSS